MIGVLEGFKLNIGGISSSAADSSQQSGAEMRLFVKTKTGETLSLSLEASDTVELLKSQLFDKRSTISYAGKKMKHGTLSDYNIQKESVLHEGLWSLAVCLPRSTISNARMP